MINATIRIRGIEAIDLDEVLELLNIGSLGVLVLDYFETSEKPR